MLPSVLLSVVFLAGALAMPSHAQPASRTSSNVVAPSQALNALFADEWERGLRDSPENASYVGDARYDDRWSDLSLASIASREAADRAALQRLHAIDRATLSPNEQLNFDIFEWTLMHTIERHQFREYLQPVTHQNGPQLDDGIAEVMPFATTADYRKFLSRLAALPARIGQAIELMKEGVQAGNVPPRVLMERVPAQIAAQTSEDPTKSPFYRPFLKFGDGVPVSDHTTLRAEAQASIRDRLVPAFRTLDAYVREQYLPRTRASIAATALPNGKAHYEFLVRFNTTTNLSIDEIHDIGLKEVARLRAAMEKLKGEIGFEGPLQSFFVHLRTNTKFFHKAPDELLNAYRAVAKRVDPMLVRVSRTIPRLPYGVRAIPANAAPDTTTAYYQPGAVDGTRPGYFYVNLYKPESRPIWEMMPLTLHESVPGHHFQFARAIEMPDVPMFRKAFAFTAFDEGWGLYAELLGYDMGLYDDPYDRFGQLTYEIWRAVRLVVDTGLHAKGWSREQAIEYMLANSGMGRTDATAEVERYIANPAQALSYKIGALTIQRLRKKAEMALGAKFDIRAFHAQVLGSGALPLPVLEAKIDRWIVGAR